ncbi:MAG: TrmB family transcriptional regulator sugar-binding domain-containing protein, partial [Halapricum sp.]
GFPRRYGTIRRCVSDLREMDGRYYASIEGRDVETGDYCLIEGEIVEVRSATDWTTASLLVDTGERTVEVGGQVAALEDVEAHEITIGRDQPPGA